MRLNCEDLNRIADVRVYVNDVLESSVYNNGRIYFPSRGISNRRIFLDCYGFAESVYYAYISRWTRMYAEFRVFTDFGATRGT